MKKKWMVHGDGSNSNDIQNADSVRLFNRFVGLSCFVTYVYFYALLVDELCMCVCVCACVYAC